MAEIKVERVEKKRSILPWILGLALLALALWGISRMMDDGRDDAREDNAAVSELSQGAPTMPAAFLLAA